MIDSHNELPAQREYLLLPKAHVHLFLQVVVLAVGILLLAGGIILLILGHIGNGGSVVLGVGGETLAFELLFFLASGILMGIGVTTLLAWALWRYMKKFRYRLMVSLVVSILGVVSGLLAVAISHPDDASGYTFYFFALTVGLLSGLLSLFYFFSGFSKHLFQSPFDPESSSS